MTRIGDRARLLVFAFVLAGAALIAQSATQQAKPVRDPKPPANEARQQTQPGTGVIAGTVVSAESGNAVRRARVTVAGGSPRTSRSIETDEQGAFRFTDLPAGDFTLTASKGGYVESIFGQKQPGSGRPGTPIHLADKQQLERVSLPLSRGAVITGAVYDETGEPAFGESVELLRWVMTSGERSLENAATATTDDRGMYRFPALRDGDYMVCTIGTIGSGDYDVSDGMFYKVMKMNAGPAFDNFIVNGSLSLSVNRRDSATMPAPATGFAPTYYPGTTDYSNAQSLTVHAGEERSGVDFHRQLSPIGRIAGTVTGPDGPVPGVEVRLINKGQPTGLHVRSMRAEKDGHFEFTAVAPGQYELFVHATPKTVKLAMAGTDASPRIASAAADEKKRAVVEAMLAASTDLWAAADVSATGNGIAEIALTLQPGMTIAGHVTTEGTGAPPILARLMLGVESVGQHPSGQEVDPSPVLVDANGDFVIRGVMPGKYRIAVSSGAPSGYVLQSAVFGGQDVLDVPFVLKGTEQPANGLVTLTDRFTELSGTVQTASGQPATDITVLAFSADERFWTPESRRIQAVRPSTDGKYTFRNLPPGEYRMIAITDIEPGRWFDPALLRTLAGFVQVSLSEGAHLTQDLRLNSR